MILGVTRSHPNSDQSPSARFLTRALLGWGIGLFRDPRSGSKWDLSNDENALSADFE